MSNVASEAFLTLVQEAARLPSDQNPYAFFRQSIHNLRVLQLSTAWYNLMYIDIGFLAFSLLMYGATLYKRQKSGTLWLWKSITTSRGTLLVPNTTAIFSCLSITYALVAIPVISLMTQGYKGRVPNSAYTWLYPLLWPLTCMMVISEIHGISAFLYMKACSTGAGITPNVWGVWGQRVRPAAVTVAFLSLYGLVFLAISIPFAISSYRGTLYQSAIQAVLSAIQVDERAWSPGEPFKIAPRWLALASEMSATVDKSVAFNRAAWIIYLSFVVLLILIFLPVGFFYIRTLSQQMATLHTAIGTQNRQAKALKASYISMMVEMVVVLISSIALSISLVQYGVNYDSLVTNTSSMEAVLAVLFSLYPIFSLCLSITLYLRSGARQQGKAGSFVDHDRTQSTWQKSVQLNNTGHVPGIRIQNETVTHVEMDKMEKDDLSLELPVVFRA